MKVKLESIMVDKSGMIIKREDVTHLAILESLSLDENIGDEKTIKFGDLRIRTRELLPHTLTIGSDRFIVLYFNDHIVNIYAQALFDTYDEKRGKYEYHFYPASYYFMNQAKQYQFYYTEDENDWNFGLQNAWTKTTLKVTWDDGSTSTLTDRYGFLVCEVLNCLAGKSGTWFRIGNITHSFAPRGENTAIWHKGTSKSVTTVSIADAIDYNLGSMNWFDFIKIMLFAHDSFLNIIPKITEENGNEYLYFDLILQNKTHNYSSPAKDILLKELQRENRKFYVAGVEISGHNFSYKMGDGSVKRSVITSDPEQNEDAENAYFLIAAEYQTTPNPDDYVFQVNYFSDDYCLPYYENLFLGKDKFRGEALFDSADGQNLLHVGDIVNANGHQVVLNRATNTSEGTAKFEGYEA